MKDLTTREWLSVAGNPQNTIGLVADNIKKRDPVVPTRAQIDKAGGGLIGYLRALRAIQRGEQL